MTEITADDLDELLARFWPLGGPYDGDHTMSAADTIHELVRYLNHGTQHRDAVPYASTAGGTLGNLSAAVHGLPQLARQLAARTEEAAASPGAYVYGANGRNTNRSAVNATVEELRDQLAAVADLAGTLSRALDTAHTLADRIGVDEPVEETGPRLTAVQVREVLERAGVDHARLTITNRPAVWSDRAGGPGSVHIAGPEPIRRAARGVLFDEGLAVAPYGDHDEWSGSLPTDPTKEGDDQ